MFFAIIKLRAVPFNIVHGSGVTENSRPPPLQCFFQKFSMSTPSPSNLNFLHFSYNHVYISADDPPLPLFFQNKCQADTPPNFVAVFNKQLFNSAKNERNLVFTICHIQFIPLLPNQSIHFKSFYLNPIQTNKQTN